MSGWGGTISEDLFPIFSINWINMTVLFRGITPASGKLVKTPFWWLFIP